MKTTRKPITKPALLSIPPFRMLDSKHAISLWDMIQLCLSNFAYDCIDLANLRDYLEEQSAAGYDFRELTKEETERAERLLNSLSQHLYKVDSGKSNDLLCSLRFDEDLKYIRDLKTALRSVDAVIYEDMDSFGLAVIQPKRWGRIRSFVCGPVVICCPVAAGRAPLQKIARQT